MSYLLLKNIHVLAVCLSISGYVVRGSWMCMESPMLNRPWVRILPHIVDTVLLVSAVALAMTIHQYPFVHAWLTAKVIGLLLYIGFGMVALRRGKTKRQRIMALFASIAAFGYIVTVALSKSPLPFV